MRSRVFQFGIPICLIACIVAVGHLPAQRPAAEQRPPAGANSQSGTRPRPLHPFSGGLVVSPSSVTLQAGQSEQFQAAAAGGAAASVTWSLTPALGTVSASGLYTAPARITASTTVRLAASVSGAGTTADYALITLSPSTSPTLATFQMSEFFGVAWPDQPIEFRYDGGRPPENSTRLLGPNGAEVPYQWVSSCLDPSASNGCILVRSNLPANANYTWTLQSGTAPTASINHPVQLAVVGRNYELTNGLTGVRILAPPSNPRPWNLAPIQGILLSNGTWTGAGSSPNLLYSENQANSGSLEVPIQTPMPTATGYDISIIDSGPLKTVLQATYTFNRPQYHFRNQVANSAGQGHYTLIVTMYANSKSILVDEDSDMQFSYYLPLYAQLMPDQARLRANDAYANSNGWAINPICGHETVVPVSGAGGSAPIVISAPASLSNGQVVAISGVQGNTAANGTFYAKTAGYPSGQFGLYTDASMSQPTLSSGTYGGGGTASPAYRGVQVRPTQDGYLDLTYTADRPASSVCSAATYRKLASDYPPNDHAAGWYVEMYQSGAGSSAPVVGIFAGRASKLVQSDLGPSMPGIYTSNRHWISGRQDAGIQVDNLLRSGTISAPIIHRNWGIFVSTQADLLQPALHQPIADEQNGLTGINLSHLYSYQLNYPDPPGGWKWLYLPASSAQQLISWVRDGTSVCGSVSCYYNLEYNSDYSTVGRALLNMWKGNSTAAVQTALNSAIAVANPIVQTLANGDNHWGNTYIYYQVALYTAPLSTLLNAVLMDNNATAAQKSLAKAMLALFGSLLWDNDWFPIDNQSGGGTGLSNQLLQYLEYRTQAVAAAPSQPFLASQLSKAVGYTTNDFNLYFSPAGAAAGSTHYQSTFFEPVIVNFQNLATNGLLSMTDPKWTAFANWELSIQTPPEPRFGTWRKWYSNGNGDTEGDVRTGMLATALNPVNSTLASNLMWAWRQSNTPNYLTTDALVTTTTAFIDPTIPAVAPQLGSVNIPGYHSVERHAFGTPNETVAWFIDGGFYSIGGHRHYDDGQVTIYAHSAPLAIDWNANLANPDTSGRFMHDSIVYDSELNHPWYADNASLLDVAALMNPVNTEFAAFVDSTTASANFTAAKGMVWTRTVRTMAFNPSYPAIYVTDTFAGPGASAGKTLTWNMMAQGPVSTPAGSITPVARFSTGCSQVPLALPSSGTVNVLGSGLQQFNFTGANWPQHATGGINWDLFLLSNSTQQQFFIGNWGHGCHSTREMNEYKAANGGPFAEVQDILRIHDAGPFTTIILPYRKTETPTRTVTQQSCGVQIVQGSETTCFNDSMATYTNGTKSVLTVYDNSTQSAFGVSASGGPQEVIVQPNQIVWSISGVGAGTRSLTLSGNWSANPSVLQSGNTFSYSFPGGAQTRAVSIVFTPAQ